MQTVQEHFEAYRLAGVGLAARGRRTGDAGGQLQEGRQKVAGLSLQKIRTVLWEELRYLLGMYVTFSTRK